MLYAGTKKKEERLMSAGILHIFGARFGHTDLNMDINMMGLRPNLVMIFSKMPGLGEAASLPAPSSVVGAVVPFFSSSTKVGAFRSASAGSMPRLGAPPCDDEDGEEEEEEEEEAASWSSRVVVFSGRRGSMPAPSGFDSAGILSISRVCVSVGRKLSLIYNSIWA